MNRKGKREAERELKAMPKQEIPNNTPIPLELPAGYVVYLLTMLESIQAPRKETDGPYLMIQEQYQKEFKKVHKKLSED